MMSDALIVLPEALEGEYSGLKPLRQTATAHVYRARDALNSAVLITEFFHPKQCQRDPAGSVSAKPDCGTTWSRWLDCQHKKISLWSRLIHPALCGIDQVFKTNGTVYIVTSDIDVQSLGQLLPDVSSILEPQQINAAADSLIDLQAYLHAFGITGLGADPAALFLDDQEATLFLSLHPYLEGSVVADKATSSTVSTDAAALAHLLHCLLTTRAPERPYKSLKGRVGEGVPIPLIATLDTLLGPGGPPADFNVRDWKTQGGKTQGVRTAKRRWLPMAAGALMLGVGIAAWFGISQLSAPVSVSATPHQDLSVQDAGPWQLDLPLQIVSADQAGGSFVLKRTGASAEFMALNPWVQDGMTVTHINGAPATASVDLRALAVSSVGSVEAAELTSLTVQDPNLPLQNNVAVIPYVWRQKVYGAIQLREQISIDGWQLTVTRVDPGITLPLNVGDVLIREQIADLELRRFADFDRLLYQLESVANPSLTLAIRRSDRSELVVGFAAERLLANQTAVSEQ